MKFLLFILVIIDNLNVFLANNDNCGLNDLNALMVRLRQLRTEFNNLKIQHTEQINATQAEIKVLKEVNGKQETELEKLRQEINNKSSEKGLLDKKTSFVARQKEVHYDCVNEIPFEIILLNEGSAFNNITNHFTAPHAGLYMFTAQLCSHSESAFDFSIYSSTYNKTYGASRNGMTSDHDCRSLTTLGRLGKNEEVYVKVDCPGKGQIEGHIDDEFWTMFTGTLLTPSEP